jgi:cellulose synthase/poly-beta-1,6-N-acetylglucosamine synthase-like glycosyltransferase
MSDMILYDFLEIVLAVMGAAYAYMSIPAIVGFFTTRHFPQAKKNHRYGIVIAARNEENVIGGLLESIGSQTYPAEYMTVFVVADNCTDRTAEVARSYGAVCYERFNTEKRTKGFALRYLFGQIDRDYGVDAFDAYVIFDADNILKSDYMEKMNNAFASGEKIITSYRNTKNWENSCIAASYALHWMRTVRLENRAKSLLGMACRVQGTGFLFSNELVKNGWNYTDLTEDRAFCADAVRKGYRISYQNEAEFYDEQPESLAVAYRQRMRWAKGHLQAFRQMSGGLLRRCFTTDFRNAITAYDMFMITVPLPLFQVMVQTMKLLICVAIVCLDGESPLLIATWFKGIALGFVGSCLGNMATAVYTTIMERDHIPALPLGRKILYCITFPVFTILGRITYCLAAVSKVEWKPIPHGAKTDARLMRKTGKHLSGI